MLRGPGDGTLTKLNPFLVGTLSLFLLGVSSTIAEHSPNTTLTGEVFEFHRIEGRGGSYSEFRVRADARETPILRADYDDGSIYGRHRAVADGSIVTVTYADWTREVSHLVERAGPRPGTYVNEGNVHRSGFLLFAAGLVLLFCGFRLVLRDRTIQTGDTTSASAKEKSYSTLK